MSEMIDVDRLLRLAQHAASPRPSSRRIRRELEALATGPEQCGMVIAGLLLGTTQLMLAAGIVPKPSAEGYYALHTLDEAPTTMDDEVALVIMQTLVAYLNHDRAMAHALIAAVISHSRPFVDRGIEFALSLHVFAAKAARRAAA